MFKTKHRINAAFAKGLMFGKAVGARDERDRLIAIFESYDRDEIWIEKAIQIIKEGKK